MRVIKVLKRMLFFSLVFIIFFIMAMVLFVHYVDSTFFITLKWSQYIFFIFFLAFYLAIFYKYTKNFLNPLDEILILIQKMKSYGVISEKEADELVDFRKMVQLLNNIDEKYRITVEELRRRNAQLEAVLSSMANGVIALDMNKKVLLINEAARRMLNVTNEGIGRHILEISRNSLLYNFIEKIIKGYNVSDSLEIDELPKKYLKIHYHPIMISGNNLGIVIIIEDLTEVKKLERMRSEFVANVSHELRTPLTSIKGFVETLKEGDIEDKAKRDKFLSIIDMETERLINLINDILSLSEIENLKANIPIEKVLIKDLVEEVLDILRDGASAKNVNLHYDIDPEDLSLFANRYRIKQMIINLVDNAIKYNRENGDIFIKVQKNEEGVLLKVKDTGIGIPKEHIPHIFERFYRVDKSRSRRLGGTGLGLAIVKHIVLSMEGSIEVESEVGKGSEFIIRIPEKHVVRLSQN